MYNPKTKLTIIIGTKCTKKFELNDTKPLPNNILKDILSKNLIKGEYEIIDNIIKYSNDIKQQIIKYYENKITYNISIEIINELIIEIKYLIDTFLLNFLIDLYEILNTKIIKNNMHKELINKCLVYSVKTKDENDENNENIQYFKNIDEYNEYINHILKPICETFKTCKYYNNEHIHYKRNSQFKIVILYKNHIIKTYYNNDEKNNNKIKESNNLCNCSLDICKCEKPNYELIKLSNNYYCNSCNKWKCRCN